VVVADSHRYSAPGEGIDLDPNPGVEPITPPIGEMEILRYYPEDGVSVVAKREPFNFGKKFGKSVNRVANKVHAGPYLE